MRKIPTPPGGSAQWQDGWQNGYEQALIDIERHRPDLEAGPRTWAIKYPLAPPAGTRVMTRLGHVSTVDEDGRVNYGDTLYSWMGALESFGPLTEVVETEVEAAVRRLREAGYDKADPVEFGGGPTADDIATVLAHVLNGGTLP